LTGSIAWTEASSPSKSVYGVSSLVTPPSDGTSYADILDSDDPNNHRWHRVSSADDTHYCHTDNAGSTWQGPF
jgi:hypothetical protein